MMTGILHEIRLILNKTINIFYNVFQGVGLRVNLSKTETMIYNCNESSDDADSEFIIKNSLYDINKYLIFKTLPSITNFI